jgi:hypothetical protein
MPNELRIELRTGIRAAHLLRGPQRTWKRPDADGSVLYDPAAFPEGAKALVFGAAPAFRRAVATLCFPGLSTSSFTPMSQAVGAHAGSACCFFGGPQGTGEPCSDVSTTAASANR